MDRFADRVVLVTGSGRGIGTGNRPRFAREGADVVVNFFRNREPAEETAAAVEALGRRALVVKANVGDLDELARLYAPSTTFRRSRRPHP
jgi:enoyl-[acyl-carrier protein] reductase III